MPLLWLYIDDFQAFRVEMMICNDLDGTIKLTDQRVHLADLFNVF